MSQDKIINARTSKLQPHPLSAKIYGNESLDGLVESIAKNGMLTPLLVTADGVVISGKRRLEAARKLGLAEVPTIHSPLTDKLEIEMAVIEANRYREKTNEQKARETAERLRIETVMAEKREKKGLSKDGKYGGRAKKKNPEENFPQGLGKHNRVDNNKGEENFPHPITRNGSQTFTKTVPAPAKPKSRSLTYSNSDSQISPDNDFDFNQDDERAPQARDMAAAEVGWSGRTAEKAIAVIKYADETGDREVVDLMNRKSVNSAFAAVQNKTGNGPKTPPFTPQYQNVWNFPGPTPGLGQPYPGQIPGDIVRNLLWLYTDPGDLVVDPFAGGGVTLDTIIWWNEEAAKSASNLWLLKSFSYDLVPSRPAIFKNDASQPPHLPANCKNAGLIILDPPYWKQKRGDYSADETNLANLGLDEFHRTLLSILAEANKRLRLQGHIALIIGATQSKGEFIDHSAHLMCRAPDAGLQLIQRIIVPYTTQQFSAPDVAWAKADRKLLKGYRDLMIFQNRA